MADKQVARERSRAREQDPDQERTRDEEPDRARTRDEERPRRRPPRRRAQEQPREKEETQPPADGQAGGKSAAAVAEAGLRQIAALTGKSPEGVTGVEPTEDGWLVSVEVVEGRRIPSSADILALYEAELDQDGSLLAYRRARRYLRGSAGNDREA